jgi:cation diffusion facilitator CzcD-associated flavoprotein CzcO
MNANECSIEFLLHAGNFKWSEMDGANETLSKTAAGARSSKSCKVAVIGAGVAGLVAAREFIREGHDVVLFEQTESVGGVWVYDPDIEDDDLLGVRKFRKRVHSSMYASLRTNLPREIMGFTDFPFLPREGRDGRRFPGHAEVAAYLEDFAEFYGIVKYVRFCTVVEYCGVCKKGEKMSWKLRTRRRDETEGAKEEVFDAVVVCSGHYSEPKLAEVPGISYFPFALLCVCVWFT